MGSRSLGIILIFTIACMALSEEVTENYLTNEYFKIAVSKTGITSFKCANDVYDTDYIAEGRTLGDMVIRYRMGKNQWQEISTANIGDIRRTVKLSIKQTAPEYLVSYDTPVDWDDYDADMEITTRFRLEEDALYWTFHLRSLIDKPIEIGDIALPLPFNTRKGWNKTETYTKRLIEHSFISGHGSFIYWMRPNRIGPYLVMIPLQECPLFEAVSWHRERNFKPTKLEYFEDRGKYMVFIHSKISGAAALEKGSNWRQPHTSASLMPKFTPDDGLTYGFKFRWANDYDQVREILYEEGLFDVHVVPGMTVPEDLEAMFSLRTINSIESVTPEYPEQTRIEYLGEKEKDTHIYKVKFFRLGENLLTVNCSDGRKMLLEFFVTEPIETLIKKRAAFLVRNQIRDPSKWYNGLLADWNMMRKERCIPEDPGRLRDYWMASDDPSLSKAPFISEKNVHYPLQKEIEALEYYLKNFVWGKLQCTDQEEYPYGIYGIPNWKLNRESKPTDRRGWTEHLWRVYDYTHIIMLYLNMYRIATYYPSMVKYLDKNGYLERAFNTAKAFFIVPYKISKWSPYILGNFNELVIVDLIEELNANGKEEEANWLKREWEKKVEYFVNEDPNLFHSEFAFDVTNFESTHALASYAMRQQLKPHSSLKVRNEDVVKFMEDQIAANIATRGWLEPAYYLLGGSKRLSYMSQMGGWSIVDYALHYSEEPEKYLRLGYASFLSGWSSMNTGRPETDYGYWYPGKANDGGVCYWGRPDSFEGDLGFIGALRTAATIVIEDPLFGLFAYGGHLIQSDRKFEVTPKDGLRKRFHLFQGKQWFHLILDRDGFAKDEPIIFNSDLSEIEFTLENRIGDNHDTQISLSGLPEGTYSVFLNDISVLTVTAEKRKETKIKLSIKDKGGSKVLMRRTSGSSLFRVVNG